MMAEMITEIKTVYEAFNGAVFPLILAILALLYFLAREQKKWELLAFYGVAVLVVLACPMLANRIFGIKAEYGNTWMVWGILAPGILAAAAGADFLGTRKFKREIAAFALVFLFCIQIAFGFDVSAEHLSKEQAGITEAETITASIEEAVGAATEAEAGSGSAVVLLAPQALAQKIKDIDLSIHIYSEPYIVYNQLGHDAICDQIALYGINSVVIETANDDEEFFAGQGFSKVLATDTYAVYVRK